MRRSLVALGALVTSLATASAALPCSPVPPGIGEVNGLHVDATVAGPAFVTWDRYGEERNQVEPRGVALGPGGAWTWADPVDASAPGHPAPIVAPPVSGVSPVLGVGAGGHAVAVWRVVEAAAEGSPARTRALHAADRSPDGTWSPEYTLAGPDAPKVPEPIICVDESYGGPAVAVDASGNAVAAWVDRDPEPTGKVLRWAARPAGGAWSAPATYGPSGEEVGLAVDASGNALMTWISGGRLLAAIRPPGGAFGTAEDLGPAVGYRLALGTITPSITFDASGRALAVWAADRQVLAATRAPAAHGPRRSTSPPSPRTPLR